MNSQRVNENRIIYTFSDFYNLLDHYLFDGGNNSANGRGKLELLNKDDNLKKEINPSLDIFVKSNVSCKAFLKNLIQMLVFAK